jgi:hypothetical protein
MITLPAAYSRLPKGTCDHPCKSLLAKRGPVPKSPDTCIFSRGEIETRRDEFLGPHPGLRILSPQDAGRCGRTWRDRALPLGWPAIAKGPAAGESNRADRCVRQPAGNDESYALPTANGGLYGKPLKIGAAETRMNPASALGAAHVRTRHGGGFCTLRRLRNFLQLPRFSGAAAY